MAKVIKIINKTQRKDFSVGKITTSMYLSLFDTDTNKELNARFKQTETMTEALVGITEYGAIYWNPVSSNLDLVLDIVCVDNDGNEYTASTTAGALAGKPTGATIS